MRPMLLTVTSTALFYHTIGGGFYVFVNGDGTYRVGHNAPRHGILDVCYRAANVGSDSAVLEGSVAIGAERAILQYEVVGVT